MVQLLNMASDCGVSHSTVRAWLSVLEAGYVLFLLQPHHQNFGKRLVKTPKLYFVDTGEEVDVVIEQGEQLMPVEIKSGQTFNTDFLAGLKRWTQFAGDAALPPQLVYGGDDNMLRSGVAVQSWRHFQVAD